MEALQVRMAPLKAHLEQIGRQFWVTKEQVKANKYDLSASRYRVVEQDETYYVPPKVTLERLQELGDTTKAEVLGLMDMLE
jgi:type I restriction enzyme M protein